MSGDDRIRIDVWLWRARFFKTRSMAAEVVSAGVYCERNGVARRIDKPSAQVAPGDGLTFRCGARLRSVRVLAVGQRRGPAAEARLLYEESDPMLDEGDGSAQPSAFRKEDTPP